MSLVMGLALLIWGISAGITELRFHNAGRQTSGQVTYSWSSATRRGQSGNCYYKFTVGGRTFTGKGGSQAPGQTIAVEYLADDPHTNRPANHGEGGVAGLFVLAAVLIGVGIWGLSRNDELLKA